MVLLKKIPLEARSFAELRKNGCIYVDKTKYIADFLKHGADSTVLTRPKLFGKTLMLSAFEEFLSIDRDSSALFEGLYLDSQPKIKQLWQNRHPVVRVSFKGASGSKVDSIFKKMRLAVSEAFCRFEHVFDWKQEDLPVQRNEYKEYMHATGGSLSRSLLLLSQALCRHYGREAVVLIDDIDAPLLSAESHSCYQPVLAKIKDIVSLAANESSCVKFVLAAGRLPVSDLVFLSEFSSFQIEDVSMGFDDDSFGFTREEVESLFIESGLESQLESVAKNYRGYFLGESGGCCSPFDVLRHLRELAKNPQAEPKAYWFEEQPDAVVSALLKNAHESPELETLLKNEPLPFDKCAAMNVRCSAPSSKTELCSRLLHQGYVSFLSAEDGKELGIEFPDLLEYVKPANRQVLLALRAKARQRLAEAAAATAGSKTLKEELVCRNGAPLREIYPVLRWKLADYAIEDVPLACRDFLASLFKQEGADALKREAKKRGVVQSVLLKALTEEEETQSLVCHTQDPDKVLVFASSWKESASEAELVSDAGESLERCIAKAAEGAFGRRALGATSATCFGLSFCQGRCSCASQEGVSLPSPAILEERAAPAPKQTKKQQKELLEALAKQAQKALAALEAQQAAGTEAPPHDGEEGWDGKLAEGVRMEDLSQDAIRLFCKDMRLSKKLRLDALETDPRLLLPRFGLATKDGACSRAAALLFHPNPQKLYPGAFIRVVASSQGKVFHLESLQGPIILQANRVMRSIYKNCLGPYIVYDRVRGAHRYAFALAPLREAVVNALCHCNWSAGIPVTVDIEENGICVSNAVDFSDKGRIGNIFSQRHCTNLLNESIASVFFHAGYARLASSGMDAIHSGTYEINRTLPEYALVNNILTLKMRFDPKALQPLAKEAASAPLPVEETVLAILKQKPKTSRASLCAKLELPMDFIDFAIYRLAQSGKIKLRGSFAHPFWHIPR